MNKLLFVANWKSNLTAGRAIDWLNDFKNESREVNFENKSVIIAPSYLSIPACYAFIQENKLPVSLAVQNVSKFGMGAYTGEVAANQANEFVKYAIIGHSERRKNEYETDEDVVQKTRMAKEMGLITIVCVQDENTPVPQNADIIAYEPVFAIGTGNPDTAENIEKVFGNIQKKTGEKLLLYGGSIDAENIKSFTEISFLSGFLIGGASLDPGNFINLLKKC